MILLNILLHCLIGILLGTLIYKTAIYIADWLCDK